ncbi:MGT family glycosyltransferase [Pseudoduganella lurida]|uniref:MGT family glycosyltransferase n=1 Tax=Pseudoduganella lurida TaxID=1036180 RepID=A0A562QWI0_9BURK|nr:glycosyltransferase [Pseudoduganella lurida]TWI61127.1 MGT family glycosyltransferase [Pseudoduganella lurida]
MAHFGVVAPAFFSHFSAQSALASELVDRGHRVTFFQQIDAGDHLADPRLGFHALGAASHPRGSFAAVMARAANPGSPLGLRRVIGDMARGTDMLCRELPAALAAEGVDFLIADQMEAAGGLVAEALNMPFVSVACALPVNREPGIPLPVMPFAYGTSERDLQMYQGSTRVYDWLMTPHRKVIEQHARAFGLSPRGMLHECLSPLAQVSQTTEGFDFPRRALPANFHHVGPLRSASGASLARDPMPAVDPHKPFVFASFGTMQGHRFGLFKRVAKACRALDVQLLIAHCGGLDEAQARALQEAGANWVCAFGPQRELLARADVVVSHAGSNTVMDAIEARTPILALPIAFDQPGTAARVAYAGIGLQASPRFVTTAHLRRMLRQLLDKSTFQQRLDIMAEELAQAGGTRRAADIIEAAVGAAQPVAQSA